MEKINIGELLKDCPTGMELDSPIVNELYFDCVTDYMIKCYTVDKVCGMNNTIYFHHDGTYLQYSNAKCVIYPKGKTTWKGFIPPYKFKDGDIITCTNSVCSFVSIFKEMSKTTTFRRYVSFILNDSQRLYTKEDWADFKNPRFATEEEKETLFKAIKDNGYRWNAETKTLEKKKKEYPKTYEECCKVLKKNSDIVPEIRMVSPEESLLFSKLIRLKRCRDAYWKIAGEEMGLGKPWEPNCHGENKYTIEYYDGIIIKHKAFLDNRILAFPTAEMRDAFKENFKELIELCKELL